MDHEANDRSRQRAPGTPREFWIDVGGTFTDCIARHEDGSLSTHKLLSNGVSEEPAPVTGIRRLSGKQLNSPIGPVRIRLGTTRGTNALLEHQGAATALITTKGFRDVLRIGYQNRRAIFEYRVRKPLDLVTTVVELDERLDAEGRIIRPLVTEQAERALSELRSQGIRSLAVCFLHSYFNARHEELVAELASKLGFEHISLSSRLSSLPKMVSRGETTVLDAYVGPVLQDYLKDLQGRMPEAEIKLMTSAGALVRPDALAGKDAILSGPAGGVVGAARVAQQTGIEKVIAFDMGGTSTDVSRYDGDFERRYEMELWDEQTGMGTRLVAPMLAIETVAAGGGSICAFDGVKPIVGPRSAGANPGPACYGQGGPLCVTDINLFLGKLPSDLFPFPLDLKAVERRLDEQIEAIRKASGQQYSRETLASGYLQIANANMIAPIKRISVARGYDVRDYALMTFGGAGGQHGCAIARELGIRRIVCSPFAGVLSALGIGIADISKFEERTIRRRYRDCFNPTPVGWLLELFEEMEAAAKQRLREEGVGEQSIRPPRRLLDMRYIGQENRLTVAAPEDGNYRKAFEREHEQLYGFTFPGREIEVYTARLEMVGSQSNAKTQARPESCAASLKDHAGTTSIYFDGRFQEAALFVGDELSVNDRISGPAIIAEGISTIVVEPGWEATIDESGTISLFDRMPATKHDPVSGPHGFGATIVERSRASASRFNEADPIELELFNNHFASVAEQMGATLQKTALSTNVKERLDFSCAIFSANGDLVVNAPHIPVHLGAMSECIRCLCEDIPEMRPGDTFITNDPYRGGSHLPDVTVVTPVFSDDSGSDRHQILFFTASRAHHAEIGGSTPGSMPPFSQSLAEEGVLISCFRFRPDDPSSESALRSLLSGGSYPSRAPDENLADIHAQLAANRLGSRLLLSMVADQGWEKVGAYMEHIQEAAARKIRFALARIPEGRYSFRDELDNGSPISASIEIQHDQSRSEVLGSALIDFEGTGPFLAGNLNANPAITTSAVIYCLRCLIQEAIPLNAGILQPIRVNIPENSLLNPFRYPDPSQCLPIVGGNVETSQRIVDVLFGALKVVAGSQGTMNNLLFGRRSTTSPEENFGYYETLAGGVGAGPDFDGADAVHSHMTNTRLTDHEVLESRYPVRVRRCEIRRGSGGNGCHRGGNGMVRELEFLAPLELSLLTSRRTTQPYGLEGGNPGESGRNLLKRAGETVFRELPGSVQLQVQPGDCLRIETPGGGGYGLAQEGSGKE